MFAIYGGQLGFKQWTKNQKLVVNKLPVGASVQFYNDPGEDDPIVTEVYEIKNDDGMIMRVCNVPNILLTTDSRIKVCVNSKVRSAYGNIYSVIGQREKFFDVESAEKPDDYVYEETPTEGGSGGSNVSTEEIHNIVNMYMAENFSSASNDEVTALL